MQVTAGTCGKDQTRPRRPGTSSRGCDVTVTSRLTASDVKDAGFRPFGFQGSVLIESPVLKMLALGNKKHMGTKT